MQDNNLSPSFVGKSGRFYVRQYSADCAGFLSRVTIWPNTEDFDRRTPVPVDFCDINDALADFDHELSIHPETGRTTWPADRDETDAGVTPARNLWENRFQKAREGRANAA